MCVLCTENWTFSQLIDVKRLPVTVRVLKVHQVDPSVDLTGHKLRIISIDQTTFLRTNAINNGIPTSHCVIIMTVITVHVGKGEIWHPANQKPVNRSSLE